MKKALQISLAKTLFTIEEDAYARLEEYLSAVRKHFSATAGSAEIIDDIEGSIAEQLIERKERIVSIEIIEAILAKMGKVEDFDDGISSESSPKRESTTGGKKLYRNPSDAIIAGVCSGIAAYFGWETLWVRLGFFALTFLNGFGFLLYIVLWVIMPEAKSAAQKLEMTGTPVTLENLSETVRERVNEIRADRKGTFAKIISIPAQLISGIIRVIGPIFRVLAGLIMTFAAGAALVAILITSSIMLSGAAFMTGDLPVSTVLPGALYGFAAVSLIFVALIPALAVFFAGIALLAKKTIISGPIGAGMLGLWFLAIAVSGFAIAKGAENYRVYRETAPEYQAISREISLEGAFQRVEVENGVDLEILKGETPSLTATGLERMIDSYDARVENGTLHISRTPLDGRICFFCGDHTPTLTLRIDQLESIAGERGAHITMEDLGLTALTIELKQGSRADIEAAFDSLIAEVRDGSYLSLDGSATRATMTATQGARIHAIDFDIQDAEVTATYGSDVDINVSQTLKATATYGARISYDGNPQATISERQGADVRSNEQPEEE